MFDRIKTALQNWQKLKEVDALSERDLDDLGLTRDQVRRLVRMPADITARVAHMAAIFGLSEEALQQDHAAYIALLETCGTCTDRASCSHVLGLGAEATPEMCRFCLNAEAFRQAAA